ncbi:MAG: 2-dehydro-3-deoxygluconokinase [uncultured Friedmanniella sp.]|uniref:2-dehydro-3-deoxygluconokinase n=1 Tax=uncultured Friedmanniella sp. TaxID=335381 RepID=A0A6J4LLP4_9ACTN|nr:sugar kinase [uncultured Friedmanniella sp.]CAA9336133.1 MAG: 2-dehydro-3-deoxygluconokinase [uncultured Friedmanniella sp.]
MTTVASTGSARPCDVLTFGETLALLRPTTIGALRHAHQLQLLVGGSESNVAIGVTRLGLRSRWVGRVGDDELGERVLREIRAEGVSVRGVVDPTAPTALMIKEQRSADQVRVSYYRRGSAGSRLEPDDLPEDWVAESTVLHVTGITPALSPSARRTVHHAVDVARASGTLVSLDLNYRQALWSEEEFGTVLRDLVPAVDVVFGSPHEVTHLVGACGGSAERQLEALAELGPGQAVLKLGARGALALVDGRLHQQDAIPVTVADPVGAGDAFVAGWLAELVARPDDVAARLATAAACGALACTVPGDWEGAPSRREVQALSGPAGDDVHR